MSSLSTFAPEWDLHEPEWEQPASGKGESEGSGEADRFLSSLLPPAAKALPAIVQVLLPAVRQLIPEAAQAIGVRGSNLHPNPAGMAGARSDRQRALRLIRELHGMVAAAHRALRATCGSPPAYVRSGGSIPVVAEPHRRYRTPAAMWRLSRPADCIHSGDDSFALEDLHCGAELVTRLLHELAS
jgi:hypothetical protein